MLGFVFTSAEREMVVIESAANTYKVLFPGKKMVHIANSNPCETEYAIYRLDK